MMPNRLIYCLCPFNHGSVGVHNLNKSLFSFQKRLNGQVTAAALWKCYLKCFWAMQLFSGFLKLLGDILVISGPLCLKGLVSFIEESTMDNHGNGTEFKVSL